tara:strand:+ start:7998 stop:8291 length:294 start_codon:yes stop_codon:yes gene_type:complete
MEAAIKNLIKRGAKANINVNTKELVLRFPLKGYPNVAGYRTSPGKKIVLRALFGSNTPKGNIARKLLAVRINGKSPSPRSANKARASAIKRTRATNR